MTQQSRTSRFVEFLMTLEERRGRGALAALRRGLGQRPGTTTEMHPYVATWAGGERSRWREDVHYLVASLFAYQPVNWRQERPGGYTNLGASFARLAVGPAQESVERRFTNLLTARQEDLHIHMPHAISLLKSKEQPVDWARLLDDLKSWDHDERWVQRNWARAFWNGDPWEEADLDTNA